MKFAHKYCQSLESEGFPVQWVNCAISYRQLKKCIKRVRGELAELGLRPEILSHLWLSEDKRDSINKPGGSSVVGFYYSFPKPAFSSELTPKLTFIVNPDDGSRTLATLSPETREHLCVLLRPRSERPTVNMTEPPLSNGERFGASFSDSKDGKLCKAPISAVRNLSSVQEVEIPLSADSEFFEILKGELSTLHELQERERKELNDQVRLLRENIIKVTNSKFGHSRPSIYTWREIFRLYIEAQVFFSTDELDSGERTSTAAHTQLVKFQDHVAKDNRCKKLGKDGRIALESFMNINLVLLQNLKFQEINRIALRKIMKKFDKRTALRAYPAVTLLEPLLAQNMAKLMCQAISQDVLSIIPQLNDYLCPICLNIAFKPVRLRCNHVFCIRCLVIMQRAKQDHCALCRREVVMEATSDNLDHKLLAFLSTAFPKETKTKQKENEKAANADLYGDTYDACSVM
ncbi:SPX and RING_Ubox domain-containing protein [Emydomyces testavorans]|uniref:SPX and RING_Ubox domain-containing protein n=1 Tax=Emydomyces testavorans TaxID=2070801 RepID=A0AAF0DKJ3_9EURO|nr:SPX and RING_Ubox domain-containing protein [Emydomyces testavorans]